MELKRGKNGCRLLWAAIWVIPFPSDHLRRRAESRLCNVSLSGSGSSLFILLPDPVLGVPLALLKKAPLCVQSALFQDFFLQPMFVSSQRRYLSLLSVPLPLCLLLSPSQSAPSLMELFLQTRAVRSTRRGGFRHHLFFPLLLLDHWLQPTDLRGWKHLSLELILQTALFHIILGDKIFDIWPHW